MKVVYNRDFGSFCLSEQALDWLSQRGYEVDEWGWDKKNKCDFPRHHKALVECVEVLGKKAGFDFGTSLKIYEIEGKQYHIINYNGSETVLTPENTPWVEVGE